MKKAFHALAMVAALAGMSATVSAKSDLYNVPNVAVKPVQAIEAAKKQFGGYATNLDLKNKYGSVVYKIELRNGNQEHDVVIDAQSGKVLSHRVENEWKPARSHKISMEKAINIAAAKVLGQVFDADLDNDYGRGRYEVKILSTDNVPHKVVVDSDSGEIIFSGVDYD
ncbi:PepSY domain-containing protein [Neisseria weaveri]|uniref:Peptidase propeptide and YPEB domain n=1 Tax=Neisseria weaveri TaxID=28091 RepID=A0A3S5AB21_9NEIS|nr:PepSY domain-containing protein [Neisseria weaveri]EGV36882.1 hypothetical protein l13_05850 [Neisseria weaveri ATCC 51223]EGV38960.1 hypothetical protein l11_00390 [Neisseria weaveri LMG 5135]SAY52032.1 Peptidase propeptide and YPEB domain [Neisseria weaveri]VEJ51452.1 Peptidase propeptide and YPEB domain [Neisseria weaveri]